MDNLFEAKAIYTDSVISLSNDEVKEMIFISLMSLFGIKMYNYDNELMFSDEVYKGEIAKVFHQNMEMPEYILEAPEEKLYEIKCMAIVIMHCMWREYRVNAWNLDAVD